MVGGQVQSWGCSLLPVSKSKGDFLGGESLINFVIVIWLPGKGFGGCLVSSKSMRVIFIAASCSDYLVSEIAPLRNGTNLPAGIYLTRLQNFRWSNTRSDESDSRALAERLGPSVRLVRKRPPPGRLKASQDKEPA